MRVTRATKATVLKFKSTKAADEGDDEDTRSWESRFEYDLEERDEEEGEGQEGEEVENEEANSDDDSEDEEDYVHYKPYKKREVLSPVTNKEARFHLLNAALGLGIVVLPSSFVKFGIIYATVGIIVVTLLVTHCLHAVIRSTYRLCCRLQVPQLSYPYCVGVAVQKFFGLPKKSSTAIGVIVAALVFICHLSISAIYVKYITQTSFELLTEVHIFEVKESYLRLAICIPLILVNCMPTVKDLVYLSIVGILASVGALVIMVWNCATLISTIHIDYSTRLHDYPNFIGVSLFATYALSAALLLEGNMSTPRALLGTTGIVNQVMFLVLTLYVIFGFLGAAVIKSCTTEHGLITHILPFEPSMLEAASALMVIMCFFSHALVCYEMYNIVWCPRIRKRLNHLSWRQKAAVAYALRAAIVLLTVVTTPMTPDNMATLISLSGGLSISVVAIILPAVLHMLIFYKRKRIYHFLDLWAIVLGGSAFIGGVYNLTVL